MIARVRLVLRSPYFWLGFLALALYSISVFGGFVDDDVGQIVNQTHVHHLSGVIWSFMVYEGFFRPLMFIYFTLCYVVFGLHGLGFHLIEVLLAVTNVLLIFWLFRQFFGRKLSFLLAGIYLLHPLNVDAISYLAHIQDILFVFFGLLSLRFLKSRLESWPKGLVVAGLLLCSILSKETGILFVLLVLLCSYLFARRNFKPVLACIVAMLGIYAVARLMAPNDHKTIPISTPIIHLSLVDRWLQIPSFIWFYLTNFLFPHNLSIARISVISHLTFINNWLPFLVELVLAAGIAWLGHFIFCNHRKYWSAYLLFTVWFAVGMVFHIQIIGIFDATVSDWWLYFPMIGLLGLMGIVLIILDLHYPKLKTNKYLVLFAAIWLVFLLWQNIARQLNYHSETSLIAHDISVNPGSYILQNEYGSLLTNERRYQQALVPLYKSASLFPYNNSAWVAIGEDYYFLGNYDLANEYFKKSVQYDPQNRVAYYDYASALINSFNPTGVQQFLDMAIKRFPNDVVLWQLRSEADLLYNQPQQAAKDHNKAEQLAKSEHYKLAVNRQTNQLTNIKLESQ